MMEGLNAGFSNRESKGQLMKALKQIPNLPNEIIEAAKAGNLVLFIGAGISRMAGHPS